MRYFILLFIVLGLISCRPKEIKSRADMKVTALPSDTVVQSTDLLYIIDQGVTSKKMTMLRMLNTLHDTANIVRGELADTAEGLRGEISGAAGWTKTGTRVSLTDTDDTLSIGTTTPLQKFWVYGNGGVSGNLYSDTLYVSGNGSGNGWVTGIGDNLKFGDNNNSSGISLSSLVTGGNMFALGYLSGTYFYYTLNPTYNWNFGAIAPTTYKMKVTGGLNVTGNIDVNGKLYLGPLLNRSLEVNTDRLDFFTPNDNMSLYERSYTSGYYSQLKLDGIQLNPSNSDPSTPAEGYIRWVDSTNSPQFYDGSIWKEFGTLNGLSLDLNEWATADTFVVVHGDSLAFRVGGAGGGVIDTTGLPEAGKLAVFTAANKIGSYDGLEWQNGTESLYVGTGTTQSVMDATYFMTSISGTYKTILSPNLAASANTYLFGTSNSRTTGIHTRFIDNAQDLMYLYRDSTVIYQDLHLRDSTYYEDLTNGEFQWLGLTPTGAVFADSLSDAGFMLDRFYLPSIKDYLKDRKDGELEWLYKENGNVKTSRGLSPLKPTLQVQALMGGVERSYRYIDDLETRVTELENKVRELEKQTPEGKNKTWLILIFSAIVVFTIVYAVKK